MVNIAIVAHDARKKELTEWVGYNAHMLLKHKLYCTGTTGKLVLEALQKHANDNDDKAIKPSVVRLLSGPLGGDQQISAMIATGEIDMLLFFCDNLATQGHQVDISALTRIASLYNIPFATNRSTADMILT